MILLCNKIMERLNTEYITAHLKTKDIQFNNLIHTHQNLKVGVQHHFALILKALQSNFLVLFYYISFKSYRIRA